MTVYNWGLLYLQLDGPSSTDLAMFLAGLYLPPLTSWRELPADTDYAALPHMMVIDITKPGISLLSLFP